jgi:hypothetical protein
LSLPNFDVDYLEKSWHGAEILLVGPKSTLRLALRSEDAALKCNELQSIV